MRSVLIQWLRAFSQKTRTEWGVTQTWTCFRHRIGGLAMHSGERVSAASGHPCCSLHAQAAKKERHRTRNMGNRLAFY